MQWYFYTEITNYNVILDQAHGHWHTVQMDYITEIKKATSNVSLPFQHKNTHTHLKGVLCDSGLDNFVTCWAVSPSKRQSQPLALQLFGCPGCGWLRMMSVGKAPERHTHTQLSVTQKHTHVLVRSHVRSRHKVPTLQAPLTVQPHEIFKPYLVKRRGK